MGTKKRAIREVARVACPWSLEDKKFFTLCRISSAQLDNGRGDFFEFKKI